MKLNEHEFIGLSEIARKTKCDCWFEIRQDKNGDDYVFDLEAGKKISIKSGVSQLAEAMVDPIGEYGLELEEQSAVQSLLSRFGIVPEYKKLGGESR